jgi:hypothetical protein
VTAAAASICRRDTLAFTLFPPIDANSCSHRYSRNRLLSTHWLLSKFAARLSPRKILDGGVGICALLSAFIMQNAPELKNQSSASMLYVFAL